MGRDEMRMVTDRQELEAVRALVRPDLRSAALNWDVLLEKLFQFRCDLIYFDVVDFLMVSHLPTILSILEDDRCYVFNWNMLFRPTDYGPGIAFEVTKDCAESAIQEALGADGPQHDAFRSIFYLNGRCGFISPAADWMVVAEQDERAAFSADSELKYTRFNRAWWSAVVD